MSSFDIECLDSLHFFVAPHPQTPLQRIFSPTGISNFLIRHSLTHSRACARLPLHNPQPPLNLPGLCSPYEGHLPEQLP